METFYNLIKLLSKKNKKIKKIKKENQGQREALSQKQGGCQYDSSGGKRTKAATKPEDLSLILNTLIIEGEN